MKRLKTLFSWRVISLALLSGIIVATSCTTDFDKINTNPSAIANPGPSELPFLFSKAQSTATQNMWNYQISQNLFADEYAQYFGCRATYFNTDRGVVRMDWVFAAFDPMYTDVVPQLQTIMSTYDPASIDADGIPSDYTKFTTAESAIASIMWVHAFHQVTDYWGPIPYFKAGVGAISVPYDAQDLIYDDFLKRLASAVTILKSQTGTPFGAFDLIYSGDIDKWIKFANTLRLRLAMRISKVDAARAQSEAEAAVTSGVMTSVDDDAFIKRSNKGGDGNGLSIMSPWGEFRMSAAMESALTGYNDPRLGEYFQPAIVTGTYEGLRNGLSIADLGLPANGANNLSHVGTRFSNVALVDNPDYDGTNNKLVEVTNPGLGLELHSNVMHAAEAYFLRAEGALNGWNMGDTPANLYNKGIDMSMAQWGIADGVAIAAYKASTATPIAPNDATQNVPGVASPAVNGIPVLYDGANATIAREQIAMQKWLALFPNGMEAWADYRRQRLPHLYNFANTDNTDINLSDPNSYMRRITFLVQERNRNKAGVDIGVSILGGETLDKVTTPLWWDKN